MQHSFLRWPPCSWNEFFINKKEKCFFNLHREMRAMTFGPTTLNDEIVSNFWIWIKLERLESVFLWFNVSQFRMKGNGKLWEVIFSWGQTLASTSKPTATHKKTVERWKCSFDLIEHLKFFCCSGSWSSPFHVRNSFTVTVNTFVSVR